MTMPAAHRLAQMNLISKRLSEYKSDSEIIQELGISADSFYRYKARIIKTYGNIAAKKTEATLEFEASQLKDNLTKMLRSLQKGIEDEDNDLGDRAAAAAIAEDIAINIYRLEAEGLRQRQSRMIVLDAKKAAKYIGDFQRQLPAPDNTPSTTTASINELNGQQEPKQCCTGESEGKVF
jgi:hypothetical protein